MSSIAAISYLIKNCGIKIRIGNRIKWTHTSLRFQNIPILPLLFFLPQFNIIFAETEFINFIKYTNLEYISYIILLKIICLISGLLIICISWFLSLYR